MSANKHVASNVRPVACFERRVVPHWAGGSNASFCAYLGYAATQNRHIQTGALRQEHARTARFARSTSAIGGLADLRFLAATEAPG